MVDCRTRTPAMHERFHEFMLEARAIFHLYKSLLNRRPVIVDGDWYPSVSFAAVATDIPEDTIQLAAQSRRVVKYWPRGMKHTRENLHTLNARYEKND